MMRAFFYVFAVLSLSVMLIGYQSGDGVLGLFFNSRNGEVPVYRFFNTARGGHLYTISEIERDYIMDNLPQWTYEGIKFDVHETLAGGTCPVYRFFNIRTGMHFYTINEAERDAVMQLDHYNYEGIKYYVFAGFAENTTAVYRFFNHVRGGHLYTVSEAEIDAVMQLPNWTYEGICFYVYPITYDAPVPKTGQTTSYRTGDDGYYQMGVQWPDPRFTDHGDGTVTDNLTGLMWTRSANIDGEKTWDDAIDWCNALTHGGHDDWRLPNTRELLSLLDKGEYSPGLPDGHPFADVQSSYYWTSSTSAGNTASAWYVHIGNGGYSWYYDKTDTNYAWAVRGVSNGPAPVPRTSQSTSYRTGDDGDYQMGVQWAEPRFTDHGDGTVTDNLTGLMWAKDANIDGSKTWDDAIDWCNALTHGSHDDWRLPNFLELHSLIDIANYNNVLPDGHPFDGVQSNLYWSSTTYAHNTDYAWLVYLGYGDVNFYYKTDTYYAWPVRSGQ